MNRRLKDILCNILMSISMGILMLIIALSVSGLTYALYLLVTGAVE